MDQFSGPLTAQYYGSVPLTDILKKIDDAIPSVTSSWNDYVTRDTWVKRFSWAIPNSLAILAILDCGPVIELGAGSGYWAMWVELCGGDIKAYDIDPKGGSSYLDASAPKHFAVQPGSIEQLENARHRTLMLCWPPYADDFAQRALEAYRGDRLIFIGEGWGGCTADDTFFDILETRWEEEKYIEIPRWSGIRDSLRIYKRLK
jgi:hypothetical protein